MRRSSCAGASSQGGLGPVNAGAPQSNYSVDYTEGAEVGYKWFQAEHKTPLFPFGFGLSYTSFAYSRFHCRFSGENRAFHHPQHWHARRH
ncbi:MAG: hypothetical protein WDM87_16105, partial [Terracidiphilus sp.]